MGSFEEIYLNNIIKFIIENPNINFLSNFYDIPNLSNILNSISYEGYLPITYVINNNNINLVNDFIKHGAELNIMDQHDKYPIIYAIENQNLDIINLLINNGANINIKNSKGITPIFYAIQTGNYNLLINLLNNGINVNISSNKNNYPLILLIISNNFELNEKIDLIEKLGNINNINNKNNEGDTALIIATLDQNMNYKIETIITLLNIGADPRIKNNENLNSIEIAGILYDNELDSSKKSLYCEIEKLYWEKIEDDLLHYCDILKISQ
jgi:ankyrin repeat protein